MNKHLPKLFKEALEELITATTERDSMEIDFEYEKSKLMFSNLVAGLGSQSQRDAQITLLLHESGWDRKMAEVRTRARIAYYMWASLKSLIDRGTYEESSK